MDGCPLCALVAATAAAAAAGGCGAPQAACGRGVRPAGAGGDGDGTTVHVGLVICELAS